MPLYEYECKNCQKHFDKITRAGTPDEEIECPKCNKNQAKRKLSTFAFGLGSDSTGASRSSSSCTSCSGGSCSTCG
ncbi:MAG: FmdB family zinc ribbon protein [Vulcanimicrobiota bacterium]